MLVYQRVIGSSIIGFIWKNQTAYSAGLRAGHTSLLWELLTCIRIFARMTPNGKINVTRMTPMGIESYWVSVWLIHEVKDCWDCGNYPKLAEVFRLVIFCDSGEWYMQAKDIQKMDDWIPGLDWPTYWFGKAHTIPYRHVLGSMP
jgi:hypothetical protein